MEWSLRGVLNPVITRLLIYGVNPIDMEFVISRVEGINHKNMSSLEESWVREWEEKASRYSLLGEKSVKEGHFISSGHLFSFAAQCYYATFLINLSRIEEKARLYNQYAAFYKKSLEYLPGKVTPLEIPLDENRSLPGYLHLPENMSTPPPCVVIYSGLGSCKEELHTLARPLVDRGIAAYVPDMPGNGEALFSRDIKCGEKTLHHVFSRIPEVLKTVKDIDSKRLGAYGLCMGGGYAHRAAVIDPSYTLCAVLFPLFISSVKEETTPQWMKQGRMYDLQTGNLPSKEFITEMKVLEEGALTCPFLFIHGKEDNWMPLETAIELYNKARGKKDKIIIEEKPAFSGESAVTHTMPVGEQLHWLRHTAADWIAKEIKR